MLNHIVIMGRLTREPELRKTASGTSVCSFSLACERDYAPNPDGERGVDFIDCVAWRGTAEFVSRYFDKGSLIAVDGRLQIRDWTDRDGNKRRSAEIAVNNAYFAGKRRETRGVEDAAPYKEQTGHAADASGWDLPPYDPGLDELAQQYPDTVRYQ